MSFETYRCMMKSEDQDDEEYAICLYPKCWMGDCPHKQARDRLAKAQELPKKWRGEADELEKTGIDYDSEESRGINHCIYELEKALGKNGDINLAKDVINSPRIEGDPK